MAAQQRTLPRDAPQIDEVQYRSIAGFPGYRVGSDGTVWTCLKKNGRDKQFYQSDHWRLLKPMASRGGYLRVYFRIRGAPRMFTVGDLVLTAFVGPRPPGHEVCHFPDRSVSNNTLANLRWGTRQDNIDDKKVHGTTSCGENIASAKLTETDVLEIRSRHRDGESAIALGARYGVHKGTINRIIARTKWKHI